MHCYGNRRVVAPASSEQSLTDVEFLRSRYTSSQANAMAKA